ncbi:Glycosyltransferase like family [uncultured Caudovirales phage]|uniref:Glycosyltransferase like family n=1 Tax=uncultured Caudovirales phage TaxID=2100421 RepID=A0A6J7XBW3_9CAUD|nr:Glycosyltransferase like family [uncultured Caudovirales phage]
MITIVSCTKHSDYKQTLLYKSLAKLEKSSNRMFLDKLQFVTQNKTGLSEVYNKFLIKNYAQILFVHDDMWIDDAGFLTKLEEGHKQYDIIGLAGGLNPAIKAPALWHIMCGGFHGNNLRGFAGHYLPDGITTSITNFGPSPARVAIIDGAFMSVNVNKIKEVNWMFNENYTFHHYDISSCIDANKKKLKIGVVPILSYHNSPGLRDINDKTFVANQTKFLQEYASY